MKNSSSHSRTLQTNCISALAFSPRHDYCAIATKSDHIVRVFKVTQLSSIDSWQLVQEMKDHSQTVADIDWAADNKIITSSHDRSVIVWRQVADGKWEKMLVNIDIKLSILVSKWAPSSKKFALGSSCNTLALGFYNVVAMCWTVSTRSSLAKAPITTLCFHPSSNMLVMGSADFSVKVIAASFKKTKDELIQQSKVEDYPYNGPFAQVDGLFEVILSIDNLGGWINHVSFENNGSTLLIVPHTNHIKLLEIGEGGNLVKSEDDIKWNGLPFLSGFIAKSGELLMGGYDKKVARFVRRGIWWIIKVDLNSAATTQPTKGQARREGRRGSWPTSPRISKRRTVCSTTLQTSSNTSTS